MTTHPFEQAAIEAYDAAQSNKHCMTDLETLGRHPYCPILSIGACSFNMDDELPVVDVFYQAVDLDSCLQAGLRVNADTLKWWMQQSEAAQYAAFLDENAVKLPLALDAFTDWICSRPMQMWGNSARFDYGILEAAYIACGKEIPWAWYCERDYRTIKSMPAAKDIELVRVGTFHRAADDAISQALHLRRICQQLQLQF